MNSHVIVAVYVAIDETLKALGHETDKRARMSDAEVLTVAVVAALYFGNHQERSLCVLQQTGYLRLGLSTSRYNRWLHQLRERLADVLWVLTELGRDGQVFIIDSMPLPVSKRVRAKRSKLVSGQAYYGYCAAKDERFFGLRLHWVCDTRGIPMCFSVLPASQHDLSALDMLMLHLPSGALMFRMRFAWMTHLADQLRPLLFASNSACSSALDRCKGCAFRRLIAPTLPCFVFTTSHSKLGLSCSAGNRPTSAVLQFRLYFAVRRADFAT